MAITDISAFAHLTSEDVENLAVELDGLRREIEESRGARDARYIRRTIAAQRALELSGRVLLAASTKRAAWWAGTVTLAVAKIIENMEIGHNVLHGQWDWMNDPEIHSSTWEWDMAGAAKHWRITHNVEHHKYTNILDLDDDVGYGLLRVTRDESWKIRNLFNIPSISCWQPALNGELPCSTWNFARSGRRRHARPPSSDCVSWFGRRPRSSSRTTWLSRRSPQYHPEPPTGPH
ncbi:fatty acid desaturase family protein [Mycobacteroides abscessus MAB_030201_1075]|uniref:Fatty acid desaturase family protein n=1 Tax=Mycobacteroides abscessus MAB_030201_1075 TaxID=1335410 RepID=A0A829PPI3_9MYCO|nr:fatty acid desaturase family protein [Mycobacteroides abscessus MAB_030201_1075]